MIVGNLIRIQRQAEQVKGSGSSGFSKIHSASWTNDLPWQSSRCRESDTYSQERHAYEYSSLEVTAPRPSHYDKTAWKE